VNDYVCWFTTADDLENWNFEDVIYRHNQNPLNKDKQQNLFTSDVQKLGGKRVDCIS
jgi:hypothetical protein